MNKTNQQIQNLLQDKSRSLIEVYLDLQQSFEEKYGDDTVVVMEVGSFFEVYGVDNEIEKIGKPKEIAEILNLQLTRKNKSIKENNAKNPLLAGFPTATFERYMQRLVRENKYTIVLIRQKGEPPQVERYLDRILSPGINFEYSLDHDDNFLASLIIEKNNDLYSVGYATADITTGKTYVFEIHSTGEDKTYALDQLFSLLKTHRTSEVLLTCAGENIDEDEVMHYLEIHDDMPVTMNTKRLNISYQNELFKQTYLVKSFLSPVEFLDLERKPLSSESFALLLEFIIEHDVAVVQKLSKPTQLDDKKFLYLGNNPLEQLNIISRDPHELTIMGLVDYTRTSIGRRLLRERLLNPIIDRDELIARYDLSDILEPIYTKIDSELRDIYDLERISRRISLGRLHPFEINFLYESLSAADRMIALLREEDEHVMPGFISLQAALKKCITHLEHTFSLDDTTKYSNTTIDTSFFQTGFDTELDELLAKLTGCHDKLETIRITIAELIAKETGKPETDYVNIKQLDKDGHHLCITKSRYNLIEKTLPETFVSIDGTVYALSDFNIKIQTTNVKITADIIDHISDEIVVLQNKIKSLVRELFQKQLDYLDHTYRDLIHDIKNNVSSIDVALSNIKASKRLNLSRPEILKRTHDTQYFELIQARHLLVEHREENGIYVPNDIVMGDKHFVDKDASYAVTNNTSDSDVYGVLLYGINSSGKSSLMKSMGVCVLLAQSGLYVPATRMRFTMFRELFTRIVAQDNFSKGLSSFAVEMMELKNIFNRATPHSLILGDEISHGTETLSALAIVSATIKRLSKTGALFMFTTHLHQLHNLDVLNNTPHVVSVHLSVRYDEDEDKLIFDRQLQAGSGSSIYGLEFAQSLHMDAEFLELATHIRKELAHEYTDLELITKKTTSTYNSKLLLTSCAICNKQVSDVHHINPQELANQDGNIKHFHKNHKYNLVPLCKSCHDDVHSGKLKIKGFTMTSEGLELEVE